jgi:5-methyltetrahydrofolate--homocysteine methyltransferase
MCPPDINRIELKEESNLEGGSMDLLKQLGDAVIEGNIQGIEALTQEAIDQKLTPLQIINDGLLQGMNVVGQRFKAQEMYIPEVLLSAETMKKSVTMLKPMLVAGELGKSGLVVIGTVKGDLHDVGKNILIMLIEAAGFEVIDLGIDVADTVFTDIVKNKHPHVIGMSAMLTTTMMEMKKVIDQLKSLSLRDQVKVIVGGAPLNQEFADRIGADAYAPDAVAGVDLIKALVK